MKELLESLGTSAGAGKPARSTSQPDTEIQSKQLSSSSSEGVAASSGDFGARGLEAPPPLSAVVPIRKSDAPRPESRAGSVSSSSLSNGSCDSVESSSLPLFQPRAAVVVPELKKTDVVTVAQTVLVGHPPSFHHPPGSPAPPPTPAYMDGVSKTQMSCSPPVIKPMLVSVPEPVATQTPSTQQAVAQCLSAPVPVKKPDCDQQTYGLSLNGLTAQPPSASDYISCPSAIPQDNEVLLGHSADHINFFSAREKFKGMSQDGKSCQLKSCSKELQPLAQEVVANEGKEEEKRKVRLLLGVK